MTRIHMNSFMTTSLLEVKSDPSNRYFFYLKVGCVGELQPSYIHRRGDRYQIIKERLAIFVDQSMEPHSRNNIEDFKVTLLQYCTE